MLLLLASDPRLGILVLQQRYGRFLFDLSSTVMATTRDSNKADYAALLNSLEKVVMELNDMENMIESFEESTAEPLFAKMLVQVETR